MLAAVLILISRARFRRADVVGVIKGVAKATAPHQDMGRRRRAEIRFVPKG